MDVGIKLRKIREFRNYTQEYMAIRLNISQSSYSRFEKNEGSLTLLQLNQIAEILEMPLNDLLAFDEFRMFGFPNEIAKNQYQGLEFSFLEKIEKLYEDKIQLLEDKIRYLENQLIK